MARQEAVRRRRRRLRLVRQPPPPPPSLPAVTGGCCCRSTPPRAAGSAAWERRSESRGEDVEQKPERRCGVYYISGRAGRTGLPTRSSVAGTPRSSWMARGKPSLRRGGARRRRLSARSSGGFDVAMRGGTDGGRETTVRTMMGALVVNVLHG